MPLTPIDLNNAEGFNAVKTSQGWVARKAFTSISFNTITGDDTYGILYGFSVQSNQGDTYHYLFSLDINNHIICYVLGSELELLGSNDIGLCHDKNATCSHAVNYNQIIVSCPSWSTPAFGFIGSTLIPAEKVEASPANPDTPALDLFSGHVCSFADRFVWAYRNQVIINNPSTEPRTLTAPNALSFNGEVTDIFQDGEGSLVIVTTNGIHKFPPDGLAGASIQGQIISSQTYSSLRPRNACVSNGQSFALTKTGLKNLSTGAERPLQIYKRPRKITQPPPIGASSDLRFGAMYPTQRGFIITYNQVSACYVDILSDSVSWFTDNNNSMAIRGVLRADDGDTIFVTENNLIHWHGSVPDCDVGVAVEAPLPDVLSSVIREVHVTATRDGVSQVSSYVRGSLQTSTPSQTPSSAITGTSVWGTGVAYETEPRSQRHQRAVRADGIYLEVGFGKDNILTSVSVLTKGQGQNRP